MPTIGRPAMPMFGTVESSSTGEVTITIRTVASGVNDPHHQFRFIIAPIADGVKGHEIEYPFPGYQSGHFETVIIERLEQGESYIFSAIATNAFGNSEPAYSASIFAGVSCVTCVLCACVCVCVCVYVCVCVHTREHIWM